MQALLQAREHGLLGRRHDASALSGMLVPRLCVSRSLQLASQPSAIAWADDGSLLVLALDSAVALYSADRGRIIANFTPVSSITLTGLSNPCDRRDWHACVDSAHHFTQMLLRLCSRRVTSSLLLRPVSCQALVAGY
jgi:hypothetical protein